MGGESRPRVEDASALRSLRRAVRASATSMRRDLPWIGLGDPWGVYVSEVMLQQTSTSRVMGPWRGFLDAFPTPDACANAPLGDVLRAWSGLGYPRRAKALHDAARVMVQRHGGRVPSRVEDLLALPGVGPYTAHAVASFAFGARVAVLDTNVGRVLARALTNRSLSMGEARVLAAALLPRRDCASFNQAMLDLGAQYCASRPRCDACPVRAHCRWRSEGGEDPALRSAAVSRPQPRYEGSDRQVRGRVIRSLAAAPHSRAALGRAIDDVDVARLNGVIEALIDEGLVTRRASRLVLGGVADATGRVAG